jgi:hypothetical protein
LFMPHLFSFLLLHFSDMHCFLYFSASASRHRVGVWILFSLCAHGSILWQQKRIVFDTNVQSALSISS